MSALWSLRCHSFLSRSFLSRLSLMEMVPQKRAILATSVSLFCCALTVPAYGTAITDVGGDGILGASALVGKPGGNGGNAGATFLSSDFLNTATATAGGGGKGGASLLLFVPGGRGGDGGNADAVITSGDSPHVFDPNFESGSDNALARGGSGGDGGGLIKGDGGQGGGAKASASDASRGSTDEVEAEPYSFNVSSSAVGGNGGQGLHGGAGGSSDARAKLFNDLNAGSSTDATATGGSGGDAVLAGGNGGSAHADSNLFAHGFPAENRSDAIAVGGVGGNSKTGLNGNGGDAVANAYGDHYGRELGVTVRSQAVGGNSGTGSLLGFTRGNGGNATATTDGLAGAVGGVDARSSATGGSGAVRGGYALATAQQTSDAFGNSSADAHGGAGPIAGAALATALSNSGFLYGTSDATATYAGPFARQVSASANVFTLENPGPSVIYTQARAGDTQNLIASAPLDTNATLLARGIIAPNAVEVAQKLIGNTAIQSVFNQGKVWGFGEFGANKIVDESSASISYVFDVNQYADPQHLWLGLLDTHFDTVVTGDFHFTVTGEGATLYDHEFTGSDFLSAFDDKLFDLGPWRDIVSADGLFDLNVSFSGLVPDIQFAFADVSAEHNPVPEPATILLLLPGLVGLFIFRPARATR